ncbi:MAG: hypothetical protein ACK4PR_04670, partial [Gammaproteobacteria bacterium]
MSREQNKHTLRAKQNSLSFKIWLGFGTTAVVLVTALLMTIYQINSINNLIDQVSATELPAIKATNALNTQINQTLTAERNWLLTKNADLLNANHKIWDNDIATTVTNLQALSLSNDSNIQLLAQLQRDLMTLKNKQLDIESNSTLDTPSLQDKYMNEIEPLVQNFRADLANYDADTQSKLVTNLQLMKDKTTGIFYVAASFLFLGLVLCGLMAVILSRSITKPIYTLVRSTKQLAIGDLS